MLKDLEPQLFNMLLIAPPLAHTESINAAAIPQVKDHLHEHQRSTKTHLIYTA